MGLLGEIFSRHPAIKKTDDPIAQDDGSNVDPAADRSNETSAGPSPMDATPADSTPLAACICERTRRVVSVATRPDGSVDWLTAKRGVQCLGCGALFFED